jgi:hypothetical protein
VGALPGARALTGSLDGGLSRAAPAGVLGGEVVGGGVPAGARGTVAPSGVLARGAPAGRPGGCAEGLLSPPRERACG